MSILVKVLIRALVGLSSWSFFYTWLVFIGQASQKVFPHPVSGISWKGDVWNRGPRAYQGLSGSIPWETRSKDRCGGERKRSKNLKI